MREELKPRDGLRGTFTATFVRFGSKQKFRGPPQKTLLFSHVRDVTGNEVCDHLWFTDCKGWAALDLQGGERVQFEARVKAYVKGYFGRDEYAREESPPRTDYKLSWPNKIRRHLRRAEAPELQLQ